MSRTKPGPKRDRGRATVETLLDTALATFAEHGLEGYTTTAILERSGVSVGSFYHHFGGLEGLSVTLLSRSVTRLMSALAEALKPTRTARTGVHAIVRHYLLWARDHQREALFIHTAPYTGDLSVHSGRIQASNAAIMEPINAWYQRHVRAGRVYDLSPALVETLILGPAALVVQRWLAGHPGIDLDEAIRHLPERTWQSVRVG